MTTSSYKIMKISIIRMVCKEMDNLALESKFCPIAMKYMKAAYI